MYDGWRNIGASFTNPLSALNAFDQINTLRIQSRIVEDTAFGFALEHFPTDISPSVAGIVASPQAFQVLRGSIQAILEEHGGAVTEFDTAALLQRREKDIANASFEIRLDY